MVHRHRDKPAAKSIFQRVDTEVGKTCALTGTACPNVKNLPVLNAAPAEPQYKPNESMEVRPQTFIQYRKVLAGELADNPAQTALPHLADSWDHRIGFLSA